MKLYNALIKKNKEGKIEDVILLKEGFSWLAFFFSIFWFLYHKMWKESFALLVVNFVFAALGTNAILSGFNKILVELLFTFVIALNANYWLVENLKTRGYEFVGLTFGDGCANAKMRFVKNLTDECKSDSLEFGNSIINPKLHRKLTKLKKQEQYFVA
jgi:hypothetical protein